MFVGAPGYQEKTQKHLKGFLTTLHRLAAKTEYAERPMFDRAQAFGQLEAILGKWRHSPHKDKTR